MNSPTKISTCSYCQARVVMSITAGSRHELICTACGAPLENTVLMEAKPAVAPVATSPRRIEADKSDKKRSSKYKSKKEKSDKKSRKKKRRGLGYWIREAIDEIEDLFD